MVKLFKKTTRDQKKSFKFNASLNLKGLSLEEYAHVIHAFQKSFSQLDQLLKESLIEQYISYPTFDRISQELKLVKIKKSQIPEVPSIKALFGSRLTVELDTREPIDIPSQTLMGPPSPPPKTPPVPPESPPPPSAPSIPQTSFPSRPPASPTSPSVPLPPSSTPIKTDRPKVSFSEDVSIPDAVSSPLGHFKQLREDDRATGIAILRQQMSEELKKIRQMIPDQD